LRQFLTKQALASYSQVEAIGALPLPKGLDQERWPAGGRAPRGRPGMARPRVSLPALRLGV